MGIYGTSTGAVTITTTDVVTAESSGISGIELGYDYSGATATNVNIRAGILTFDINYNVTGDGSTGEGITNNIAAVYDLFGGLIIDIANGVTVSSGNSGGGTSGYATGAIYLSSGASGTVGGRRFYYQCRHHCFRPGW
ncbi:hypothetical protein [Desulfobacter hydrogenophilus]|uniref:Uncharacterized protein n=1 Tax=Desulfobacter hydrogenophilus TaxID=2291 RepID=A0ABX5RC75_9BACT|nr:hypothetical protein [Desulfobacter hydrogenophilus]NDY73173.1 hypothetical protein [Desulfobacter hydrogenophilus]QBH12490.1 hypothetical protein EYB58_05935 [Desulfobacter hydrogenophilus]